MVLTSSINTHMETLQKIIKEETINIRVTRDFKNKVVRHCNETEQTITQSFIQAIQEVLNNEAEANIREV